MADPHPTAGLLSLQALYIEQAKLARALLAPLTHRGYASDMQAFAKWCAARGLESLPASADTLCLFVTDKLSAGRKTSTVRRLLAGIIHAHQSAGHALEGIERAKMLLEGARHLRPEALEQVLPLTVEDLRAVSKDLLSRPGVCAVRDRAILVVGFCSALRAASLIAIDLADISFENRGAVLHIQREKNDQRGCGRELGLPWGKHPDTCPVTALRAWIERRGGDPGPLFTWARNRRLTAKYICTIVQRALRRAGRPDRNMGSHSMRRGCITAAGSAGASDLVISAHSGHANTAMVRRYFRPDPFEHNVVGLLDI